MRPSLTASYIGFCFSTRWPFLCKGVTVPSFLQLRPQVGLRKKGKSKLGKRQTKRQSNGFSRKYRTFYVNVLQGGNALVRWVKYLSVGAKNLSVGVRNSSVGLPFCCLFFPGIFKSSNSGPGLSQKKARDFFRRPNPKLNRRSCNHRNPHLTRDKAS